MDYRKYSEDELRDYGIWRVSLPTMKKEVKLLDEVTVNAINYAADRVDGTGPFDNEDFLLSKMIEKDDKIKNIKFNRIILPTPCTNYSFIEPFYQMV